MFASNFVLRKVIFIFVLFAFSQLVLTSCNANEKAIIRVWVPAPRFTDVLHSYKNVQDFASTLDELNFNAIFLVSYAESQTIYPGSVLQQYGKFNNLAATNCLA